MHARNALDCYSLLDAITRWRRWAGAAWCVRERRWQVGRSEPQHDAEAGCWCRTLFSHIRQSSSEKKNARERRRDFRRDSAGPSVPQFQEISRGNTSRKSRKKIGPAGCSGKGTRPRARLRGCSRRWPARAGSSERRVRLPDLERTERSRNANDTALRREEVSSDEMRRRPGDGRGST